MALLMRQGEIMLQEHDGTATLLVIQIAPKWRCGAAMST
jgi:hypothetical protein